MTKRKTISLDADGRKRLADSIAHWRRLATGTAGENEDIDASDCALCDRWMEKSGIWCEGCPVSQWTGQIGCRRTPYASVQCIEHRTSPRFRAAAARMLAFLEKLETRVVARQGEVMSTRTEIGCAGHNIISRYCQYRRHTQIDGLRHFRVSTVGDYYLSEHSERKDRRKIGAGEDDCFETYVFTTTNVPASGNEGCGCREVTSWLEIDGRRTATAGEAQRVHEEMVEHYMMLAAAKEPTS